MRIDIEDLIRKQWSLMSLQCFQSIEKLKLERNSSVTLTIVSKQIVNVSNHAPMIMRIDTHRRSKVKGI